MEVFQNMWFIPVREGRHRTKADEVTSSVIFNQSVALFLGENFGRKKGVSQNLRQFLTTPETFFQDFLLTRCRNITDVVISCKDTGLEWFEQLLESMFR